METVFSFLAENPVLAIFLSLAIGYCIGMIKVGSFTIGATIGTLLTAFILSRISLAILPDLGIKIPGVLETLFSILFCFTLGYEAGPAFFSSLRSQGIKYVLQSVFFCLSSLICLYLLGLTDILDTESLIGMAAGALTQSSILTVADHSSVAYAVTYIFGTILAILFASVLGPLLLRTDLPSAVKQHLKKNNARPSANENHDIRIASVFPRAYLVENGSQHIGSTVEELEDQYTHSLQIEKIFREDSEISFSQDTRILCGDVLTIISPTRNLIQLDDEFLREVGNEKYLSVDLVTKEIIVTEIPEENILDKLSSSGIILRKVTVNGKDVPVSEKLVLKKGAALKVSGMSSAVKKMAEDIGYLKESGDVTDVPFVFLAVSAAVILGSLKLGSYSFGSSTCALLLGLFCGWFHNRHPRRCEYPASTRWFMKSVGLNLFIAAKGLNTEAFAFDKKILLIVALGIVTTLLPHIVTLFFSKYILKMDDADILGGQCGSGTCSAALNTLSDSTGSSVFMTSFATTNAISNILLTVVGVILSGLL